MALQFSDDNEKRFQDLLGRYPNKMAALIPTLYLAQRDFGYLRDDVMEYVAERLDLPPSQVLNTATFSTMLYKKPVGKHHVEVCTNVSCFLRGSDEIVTALTKKLGVELGETTEDGMFTLNQVQCIAACGTAPALQVNSSFHEDMTVDSACALIDQLRNNTPSMQDKE